MNMDEWLTELNFEYDEFFGLTERTKWIEYWTTETMNDNETAIIQLALNHYRKQIDDVKCVTTSMIKKNSFIQLLVKFKDTEDEELVIIQRINNTKFKISIDSIEGQREIIVEYINAKRSLYN